ncbi:MAG: hypothetical protein QF780_00285 [Candidatus Marinimicrobia bacterium]|nr:hypothetical protein [Candidatus Neomarinimicrobiota bacterium]
MKNIFKKQERSSISVIRAVNRINGHLNKETSRSIVWDGRSITHSSITS